MERVARTSIVDVVVDRLRDEIRKGSWPVGSKIPTEAKLVEALGVSRPSIREAVRSLVQLGLLESRQGDGTYVVAEDETTVALQRVVDTADRDEVQLVRHTLEVLAAREAATNRSAADIDALRVALQGRRSRSAWAFRRMRTGISTTICFRRSSEATTVRRPVPRSMGSTCTNAICTRSVADLPSGRATRN